MRACLFSCRLNAFGYLTLEQLGSHSGNFGLQDQIIALRWVKKYIGKFGGDPNKVQTFFFLFKSFHTGKEKLMVTS